MTIKKPKPVAYVRSDELSRLGYSPSFGVHNKANSILLRAVTKDQAEKYGHDVALVTESDMQTYAQARVDAALKWYALTLRNGLRGLEEFDHQSVDLAITDAGRAIRALKGKV